MHQTSVDLLFPDSSVPVQHPSSRGLFKPAFPEPAGAMVFSIGHAVDDPLAKVLEVKASVGILATQNARRTHREMLW